MPKRIRFFIVHLGISISLALLIISIVFFIWYPYPLAKAVGVTPVFLMLLAIDVIIGPVLCLIIYKEGKKALQFDLTVIIFIQILALFYGIYNIADGRPVWIVYSVDRFELVRNFELDKSNINQASPLYKDATWFKPKVVAIQISTDQKQRSKDLFDEVLGGGSIIQRPERFVSYEQVGIQVKEKAQPLEYLTRYNSKEEVSPILWKYPQASAWLPLKANNMDMVVLIDKQTANIIQIVDLRPWK